MKREILAFFDGVNERVMNGATVILAVFLLGLVGWRGWSWYSMRKGAAAQQLMSDCLEEYRKAQVGKTDLWNEVVLATDLAYDQAKGTGLDPYFVIMKAQAQAGQGHYEQAIALMEDALNKVPHESVFYAYFKVSQGLMKLNAPDQAVVEGGLQQLQALAADTHNIFCDIAAYHVGHYYWLHDQRAKAQEVWQQLVDRQDLKTSPWVELAQQKLSVL